MAAQAAEKWLVKAVAHGDSLTLFQPDGKTFPPPEKQVMLGNLECPRMARVGRDGTQPDEEFGWQAREYVRKRVIGRQVMFTKEAKTETGREIGQVLFKEKPDSPPQNLAVALVKAGLASVRSGAKGPIAEALADAEKGALTGKVGKYADNARILGKPRRLLSEPPSDDVWELIAKQGKEGLQAVIEYIISGHVYKVTFLDFNQQATIQLTGINTGNEKKLSGDEQAWARQARCHAERLLLHREVKLVIDGLDKYQNILASVVSKANVFQEELLKQGLAKVFDPTISECAYRGRLRAAQSGAQQAKAGVWRDYIPPVVKEGGKEQAGDAPALIPDFSGTVLQIVTPDTIVVRSSVDGAKIKCSLASVRAGAEKTSEDGVSRLARVERQVGSDDKDKEKKQKFTEGLVLFHNLFWEAREFVRKQLVGKEVKVEVDYMMKLPAQGDREEITRPAVTMTYEGGKNIAEELIKSGLGIVMGSRDGVSRHIDRLRDGQAEAQAAKLAGWSGKALPTIKIRDNSKPQQKTGASMLTGLKRAGSGAAGVPKLKCIVEFVMAPARVKLYVEREKTMLCLNMAGICTPSMGMDGEEPDPLAPEALSFAESKLQQRDVEVAFEAFHGGSFIGNLYVGGKNFALQLLAEGLATTEGQNLQSMSGRTEAAEIEAKARAAKKGIWAPTATLPKRALAQQARYASRDRGALTVAEGAKDEPVIVTEVIDSGHFWYQVRSKEAASALNGVEQLLAKARPGEKSSPSEVRRDDIVAARFSQDKVWYRARVLQPFGVGRCEVQFIDYGNKEITPLKEVKKIDEITASVRQTPALAHEGFTAFIQAPGLDQDYGNDGARCLHEYVQSAPTLRLAYTDARRNKFFVVNSADCPSFQEEILSRGFAFVRRELEADSLPAEMLKPILAAQEKAKRTRGALWRYGDPRDDDTDDYRHVGRYN